MPSSTRNVFIACANTILITARVNIQTVIGRTEMRYEYIIADGRYPRTVLSSLVLRSSAATRLHIPQVLEHLVSSRQKNNNKKNKKLFN